MTPASAADPLQLHFFHPSDAAAALAVRTLSRAVTLVAQSESATCLAALSCDPSLDGTVAFRNSTFTLRGTCDCAQRTTCPLCVACTCPDSAWMYLLDGRPVSFDAYSAAFDLATGPHPDLHDSDGWAAWQQRAEQVHSRRQVLHNPTCPLCCGQLLPKPNFHHHSSDSTISWHGQADQGLSFALRAPLEQILTDCLRSLAAR